MFVWEPTFLEVSRQGAQQKAGKHSIRVMLEICLYCPFRTTNGVDHRVFWPTWKEDRGSQRGMGRGLKDVQPFDLGRCRRGTGDSLPLHTSIYQVCSLISDSRSSFFNKIIKEATILEQQLRAHFSNHKEEARA